jgi:hypothetical protein
MALAARTSRMGSVVIAVPPGPAERWTCEVIDAASEIADRVWVVPTDVAPTHRRRPLQRAYLALDRRLQSTAGDGLEVAPPARAGGRPPDEVDVVVRLAAGDVGVRGGRGELVLLVAGAPVWEGSSAALGGADHAIGTRVELRRPQRPPLTVAAASSGRHPLSVHRSRDAALAPAAGLVAQAILAVAEAEADPVSAPRADHAPADGTRAGTTVAAAGRVVARRAGLLERRPRWRIALRPSGRDLAAGDVRGFRTLPTPAGEEWADPFLLAHDGRHHLFFEHLRAGCPRGVISHVELRDDGTATDSQVVLEHDSHLSYPFVFEQDGTVYMIPETLERGRIELYRAERVPDRWAFERVLIDGIRAVDATVFAHDGRLWLFAAVAERRERISAQLALYHAGSLASEWQPHPQNPVVRDIARARPAGRIVRRFGGIIRPGQDCSGRYGGAIVVNRIDELNPDRYAETPVRRIRPNGWIGAHCWDGDGRHEVIDVIEAGS